MNLQKTGKSSAWQGGLLPVNTQAELRVLGSILLVNECIDELTDIITENDFYDYRNKAIFQACCKLIMSGKPADFLTIPSLIQADDWNPGLYALEIVKFTPTAANVEYFARIVKQKSIDRAYLNTFRAIERNIAEESEDRHDSAQQALLSIENSIVEKPRFIREFSQEVLSDIIERYQEKRDIVGLPSGFTYLDKLSNGFKPGDYVILAARPSMGKTMLALNIAQQIVFNAYNTVIFFSLEMTKKSLTERLICASSGIEMDRIKKATFPENDIPKLIDAVKSLDESKLLIDDSVATSMQIRSKCRQVKRQHGLSMVIIDYLQLIGGYDKMEETRRITQISKDLKNLAKELNVPVIALSQLNRNLENRADKRPVMADLRQSGAIEQDADMILFIYRDEVYNESTPDKGIAEILLAKNRDGETGKVKLLFKGRNARFENYSFCNQSQIITKSSPPVTDYKKKGYEFD